MDKFITLLIDHFSPKRLSMAVCILMAIICGILFYGIFPLSSNPFNPAQMWEQQKDNGKVDNGTLHIEIHECHSKIIQMLDEANAEKSLEKSLHKTIGELRATTEKQQSKEVSAKWRNFCGILLGSLLICPKHPIRKHNPN
jgi:hypothetical protein